MSRIRERTPASGATRYGAAFQESIKDGSLESARRVVPIFLDLIRPVSVVDIGCGTGSWLSVFRDLGVEDVCGVDGSYIDRRALLIPPDRFEAHDVGRPFSLGRRFDLAVSVEVAEHVPAAQAESYVRNLTVLSDVIAFSAAIPNQGGEGHINEQWPPYWRALFERHGFVVVDCLRHRIWNDAGIEKWYRQNLLLYVRDTRLASDARLSAELDANRNQVLSIVHPDMFFPLSLRQLLKSLPSSFRRAFKKRL